MRTPREPAPLVGRILVALVIVLLAAVLVVNILLRPLGLI